MRRRQYRHAAGIAPRLWSGSMPSVVSVVGSPRTAETTTDTEARTQAAAMPHTAAGWSSALQAVAHPDDLAAAECDKPEIDRSEAQEPHGQAARLYLSRRGVRGGPVACMLPAELEASRNIRH